MTAQKLIAIKEFCVHHNVSTDLIYDLQQYEMIRIITVNKKKYIQENSLPELEKMVRLHRDLQINLEGIQTIFHLLSAIGKKENELKELRDLLAFYAPGS